MPRIRTIKPEFCTSEQIGECSTNARLLFVTMWCFCDDAGRHTDSPMRLKAECFPFDAFTKKHMQAMVDELVNAGLLVRYTYENQAFLQVTGWKHQKIDRPHYKYPPLDESGCPAPFDEHSTNDRRTLDEHSPPEGNGRERKGMEGNGVVDCPIGESSPIRPEASEGTGYVFVLCDGQEWELSRRKLAEYRQSFPELDLDSEFRRASQWLRDNVKRRKTARGMTTFLGSWLGRSQNRGGAVGSPRDIAKKEFAW